MADLITENYMTLSPAYGRDYKNKMEVEKDFNAEKDFIVQSLVGGGSYVNKQQFAKGVTVNIRFKAMRNIAVIKVK